MFSQTYYHGTLQKYVVLFGTLFNNIWVNREDNSGNAQQSMKVPITYSPRDKMIARINGMGQGKDPLKQPFAAILPRMGFEISSFSYASERKLTSTKRFASRNIEDSHINTVQYNPVPYDIVMSLSIYVKNTVDGTMIIEQILPYFTPDWTTTIKLIDDPPILLDIPVVFSDISNEDVYEGSFEERRMIVWTLNFTIKGFFFGPTRKEKLITLANTNFYDSTLFDNPSDSTIKTGKTLLYPGMDATGNPTTNKTETIDRSLIYPDDNYGIIVDKIEGNNET